jgi:hypothetical protein
MNDPAGTRPPLLSVKLSDPACIVLSLAVGLGCVLMQAVGSASAAPQPGEATPQGWSVPKYGKLQLSFEANRGTMDDRVKFLSRGPGYALFLTANSATLALRPSIATGESREEHQGAAVRLDFVGANPSPRVSPADPLPGKVNYLIGNDPQQWRTNIPTYARVRYESIYPGIDLVFYGNQGQLEYDFVVAPGADPRVIQLSVNGAQDVSLADNGDLLIETAGGELLHRKPIIYQQINGARQEVAGYYMQRPDGTFGIAIGPYDTEQTLLVDPVLVYATYLGGGTAGLGAQGPERVNDIAVDGTGNAYVVGTTDVTDFPTTLGAFDTDCGPLGSCALADSNDAFVAKLSADGSTLLYSTYLGGSDLDFGFGIDVDSSGNAYVVGGTRSTDFPKTLGALDPFKGGFDDGFVTKLNPTGSGLVYSTYLGGASGDLAFAVTVDATGNAYVTGDTAGFFPVTAGSFQIAHAGSRDVFVAKLNAAGNALVYATYVGGSSADAGRGITIDASGNVFVTGDVFSLNYPTTAGAFDATCGATIPCGGSTPDAFVTKLNANGTALIYSTYLGGDSVDRGRSVGVDSMGRAYVFGPTFSINFPTLNAIQSTKLGSFDCFLASLTATGGGLVYSTYLGSTGGESCEGGGAVDSAGNAYVSGGTANTGNTFPSAGVPAVLGPGGGSDAFVTKVDSSGSLLLSVRVGGTGSEASLSLAIDGAGAAYIGGLTQSIDDSLATVSAAQTTYGGHGAGFSDGFVAKIVEAAVNQAPVANAGPDQTMVECTSSDGALVTLDGSGSDDDDDDTLTYAWTGPFPEGGGTVTGVDPIVMLPLGTSTITLVVNDGTEDSGPDTVDVTVQDTTAPVLTLLTTSVEVPPTTATGAVVDVLSESGASAVDACDDNPVITHNGPAEFPTGFTTDVTITATDASTNADQKVFSVKVLTVSELIQSTIDKVISFTLPQGTTNSLVQKLANAQNALSKGQTGNVVNKLEAFANEVEAQRRKALTTEQADELIACIQVILDLLTLI